MTLLIVVPTLNEEAHIATVLHALLHDAPDRTRLVVVDGGSTDDTRAIVAGLARTDPRILWLHNPRRLQGAGVNLAVQTHGDGAALILRADAHARYPAQFATTLMDEMRRTGAASVTVPMVTLGGHGFRAGVAAAQNSLLGTGGSAHRSARGRGRFVDHGHHALMRRDAFVQVGGYDPTQSYNEDAELDHRLRLAGHRLWLTSRVVVEYVPRGTPGALFRQYANHGRGRAMTLRKHRLRPKPRQAAPLLVPPALLMAAAGGALSTLDPLWAVLVLPAAAWMALCLAYGALLALRLRSWPVILSGPAAMIMHLGWALGFYQGMLQ